MLTPAWLACAAALENAVDNSLISAADTAATLLNLSATDDASSAAKQYPLTAAVSLSAASAASIPATLANWEVTSVISNTSFVLKPCW